MPRNSKADVDAMIARATAGAEAAKAISDADRRILDDAYGGVEPDDATKRRLVDDPIAAAYSPRAIARWTAEEALRRRP